LYGCVQRIGQHSIKCDRRRQCISPAFRIGRKPDTVGQQQIQPFSCFGRVLREQRLPVARYFIQSPAIFIQSSTRLSGPQLWRDGGFPQRYGDGGRATPRSTRVARCRRALEMTRWPARVAAAAAGAALRLHEVRVDPDERSPTRDGDDPRRDWRASQGQREPPRRVQRYRPSSGARVGRR